MSKLTAEMIVLPVNTGLREAYSALLKSMYVEELDDFWLDDIINTISLDCGISVDTAKDRCKQLIRFKLIKYIYSSLCGHRYRILVFFKNGEAVHHVDSWDLFEQLIKGHFDAIVETDLLKIRKSMNTLEESGMREKAKKEVELEAKRLEQAVPVLPGEDVIKTKFVADVLSTKELCDGLEASLKKSNSTLENETVLVG